LWSETQSDHIQRDACRTIRFLIPVGLGLVSGIALLAVPFAGSATDSGWTPRFDDITNLLSDSCGEPTN